MNNFSLCQLKSNILKIKRLNRDNNEIIHFKIKYKTKRELYIFYKKHKFSHILPIRPDLHINNPHIRQNYLADYKYNFSRTLLDNSPTMKYRRRKDEEKSVLHWGQRKLLLVEIEFLTNYSNENDIVLYAGAAPGIHIKYLSKLFPTLSFILYDPNDFSICETDKIKIFQSYFTKEIAGRYANYDNILFMSDIRTADHNLMDTITIEKQVEKDNELQKDCYIVMNPKKSLLKFRLPWKVRVGNEYKFVTKCGNNYNYLKGDIIIQPWKPQTSTETRLLVDKYTDIKNIPMTVYDNIKYEEQIFYFNNRIRPSLFEHKCDGGNLDHCYDCTSECVILSNYINKCVCEKKDTIEKMVINMSKNISHHLGNRKLDQPQPPAGFRKFKKSKLKEHKKLYK